MAVAGEMTRVHLKIHGRVQGVYYRASTVQEAQKLGLTGWVMNCLDGSVEAVAEGARQKLDELIVWCRQGPTGAPSRVSTLLGNNRKIIFTALASAAKREFRS